MTTYFVPIERRALPADNPLRWTILVLDTVDAPTALLAANLYVRSLPVRGWTVWAAVRDCPTFGHMQELRNSMDACRYARRSRGPVGSHIPEYV